jgi:hypothetical protein
MRALAVIASQLTGVDYLRDGLTLERMGLAGVDPDGLHELVTDDVAA